MNVGIFSEARRQRLHEALAGYVERGEVPGLVALVAQDHDVHVEAIGTTSAGGPLPMRRDTIFRIASMTKPITAAATMMLVEEGKLELDEPVDRFLPELAHRQVLRHLDGPLDDTVPAHRPITVRDLLTFRLGFGAVMAPPGRFPIVRAATELGVAVAMPRPALPAGPDEWIRRLGTLPLMHQPGERWMYHTGSDVLSVLVARASGQPFDTFLHDRFFEPLEMKDTAFSVPPGKLDRFATSYWINPQTGREEIYDPAEGGDWSRPPAFPSGGGGLVSTVDDYLAFCRMLLRKGKHGSVRLLAQSSVVAMTSDQLTTAEKAASEELFPGFFATRSWGFGMSVVTRRATAAEPVGLFGWDGGLGTSSRCDPDSHLIGILLTQKAWTNPIPPAVCRDFWAALYEPM